MRCTAKKTMINVPDSSDISSPTLCLTEFLYLKAELLIVKYIMPVKSVSVWLSFCFVLFLHFEKDYYRLRWRFLKVMFGSRTLRELVGNLSFITMLTAGHAYQSRKAVARGVCHQGTAWSWKTMTSRRDRVHLLLGKLFSWRQRPVFSARTISLWGKQQDSSSKIATSLRNHIIK